MPTLDQDVPFLTRQAARSASPTRPGRLNGDCVLVRDPDGRTVELLQSGRTAANFTPV